MASTEVSGLGCNNILRNTDRARGVYPRNFGHLSAIPDCPNGADFCSQACCFSRWQGEACQNAIGLSSGPRSPCCHVGPQAWGSPSKARSNPILNATGESLPSLGQGEDRQIPCRESQHSSQGRSLWRRCMGPRKDRRDKQRGRGNQVKVPTPTEEEVRHCRAIRCLLDGGQRERGGPCGRGMQ